MLTRPSLLTLAFVFTASLASPSSSQACDGYGVGYGWGIGQLYNSLEYRVPYFAAHPPVYYSYPVPRTYGYSPFAYLPHVRTPEVADATAPLQISNPYVPKASETKAENGPEDETVSVPQRATPSPLVIANPYVTDTKLAKANR